MVWLWVAVGWVVCGVLAYGLLKNYYKACYQFRWWSQSYDKSSESLCRMVVVFGLAGLIVAIIHIVTDKQGSYFGLCFRMPRELCEPRKMS